MAFPPPPAAASARSAGAPRLVLVPTGLERRRLADHGGLPRGFALQALAGFGPVAAAARAAAWIERVRPAHVLLIGIAGTFDSERLPVGSAAAFTAVAIEGVGVGEGQRYVGPPALGFPQWPGPEPAEAGGRAEADGPARIEDRLPLWAPADAEPALLLTTCAASDGPALAARRRERFPDAHAEDMEGFGVALACALRGVPCSVIRGISNVVGDREPARWKIPAALAAARRLVVDLHAAGALDGDVLRAGADRGGAA